MTADFLKRTLLVLWAAWLTVVLTTNVPDALKALGLLPARPGRSPRATTPSCRRRRPATACRRGSTRRCSWASSPGRGSPPPCSGWPGGRPGGQRTRGWHYAAFASAFSLWLGFAIADEVFITYEVEGTHLGSMAQLLTLLAVELLPEARR